jgi:hypothetical protein
LKKRDWEATVNEAVMHYKVSETKGGHPKANSNAEVRGDVLT